MQILKDAVMNRFKNLNKAHDTPKKKKRKKSEDSWSQPSEEED